MTYLEAAYIILQATGQPLHYEEITQRALDQNLIAPQGLTPAATMGSRLYTDTKQEGSRFVRAGHGRLGLAQWQPKGIEAHAQQINQATRVRLAQLLQTMQPDQFEALVGELLIHMGFDESSVTVTKRSHDGGIDVIGTYRAAGLTEVNAAVQVKKQRDNVRSQIVTQLRGSLQVHQQGIIITTGGFSAGARKEAGAPGKTRIGLIDGEELLDLLIQHEVGVTEKTLTALGLDDEFWGELVGAQSVGETDSHLLLKSGAPEAVPDQPKETGRSKPVGFALLGQTYSTDSWRGILLGVCEVLAQRHGEAFAPAAFTVKGKKRQYVAPSLEGMTAPVLIPGTHLWVETNQSAASVLRVVERLLVALGHDPSDFTVTLM